MAAPSSNRVPTTTLYGKLQTQEEQHGLSAQISHTAVSTEAISLFGNKYPEFEGCLCGKSGD